MEEKKKRKQVVMDINADLHYKIKLAALRRNITMNNWLQRAIFDRLAKEEKE